MKTTYTLKVTEDENALLIKALTQNVSLSEKEDKEVSKLVGNLIRQVGHQTFFPEREEIKLGWLGAPEIISAEKVEISENALFEVSQEPEGWMVMYTSKKANGSYHPKKAVSNIPHKARKYANQELRDIVEDIMEDTI